MIRLKIADVMIELRSRFKVRELAPEVRAQTTQIFDNFLCFGTGRPDISIEVKVVDDLPDTGSGGRLFATFHEGTAWSLFKSGSGYVYRGRTVNIDHVMFINAGFNKAVAYFPAEEGRFEWRLSHVCYDFLQVLLINYLARDRSGVFIHAAGVKDIDSAGLMFVGKSEAGKSTTARIWHRYSKATVLNDDRVIVRKIKGRFFIHSSLWHGEFRGYFSRELTPAVLKKAFFIHHSPVNQARRIDRNAAFNSLYPATFPAFWNKVYLGNIINLCRDLVSTTDCFDLGFVNDREIIRYLRRMKNA